MVSLVDTWRTSPELARVKTPGTSTMRGSVGSIWGLLSTAPGQGSPGCQLHVNDPAAGVQVDQDAVEHALAVLASRGPRPWSGPACALPWTRGCARAARAWAGSA